jgi:hypothetical protein
LFFFFFCEHSGESRAFFEAAIWKATVSDLVIFVGDGFEGGVLMSLFWIVIRQLAEIEAMVILLLSSYQFS